MVVKEISGKLSFLTCTLISSRKAPITNTMMEIAGGNMICVLPCLFGLFVVAGN